MAALKGSLQPSMTLVMLGMLGLLPTELQAVADATARGEWPGP
jgi:hypothetical protein